jgi:hypothetical protein
MPQISTGNMGSTRPLLVVVILGGLVFAWIVARSGSGTRQLSRAARECQARYAEARTFRDTVAVDATYPTEYALETSSRIGPATCGRLRHEGGLR